MKHLYTLQIVRFFNDEDSDHSPFSLHKLVRVGEASGKKPGDWYGPNSVAHTIWFVFLCKLFYFLYPS